MSAAGFYRSHAQLLTKSTRPIKLNLSSIREFSDYD